MSRLTDLLREAKKLDPKLGDALEDEVRHLQQRRAFGLNFERHTPEAVELYGRPVRVGDKVRMLPPRGQTTSPDKRLWIVTGGGNVDGVKRADLRDTKTGDETSHPIDDLVVVAEHTDVIYPGLVSTGKIERGGDKPFHTVINGENLHALKALLYTHTGKIDCIYIDPPYNTGNGDWIYNDNYVTGEDLYRHSKWLAFMERRLQLARELLKDTGVIIVAIGDDEHHRLRMLMDQVFSESNFISDVVWQGGRKNDSRYVSNGADYMLIYARNAARLAELGVRWREQKDGVAQALSRASEIWRDFPTPAEASAKWKAWLKAQKASGAITDAVARYDSLDPSTGRPIHTYGDLTWPGGGGGEYEVLHPVTRRPVKMPVRGWLYKDPARMQVEIDAGRVFFGADEQIIPRGIRFLDEMDSQVPLSVFSHDRKASNALTRDRLGATRFPNAKDYRVLMRWLSIVSSREAQILDFFGGSGSTLEAVARLNAQDGGTRRCILVTNNEVGANEASRLRREGRRPGDPQWEEWGVHDYVTKPRITAVVQGVLPDGSTFGDTVDANVEFLTLTYEAPLTVSTNHAFVRVAPLLWLRAGSRGRRIESLPDGWDVAEAYGVIERLDRLDEFLTALEAQEGACVAFIVTDDDRRFQSALAQLPNGVEPVRLYESYLRNFQIDAVRSTR